MIPSEAMEAAEQAVIDAMIKYGPDGHIDGFHEITRAALEAAAPYLKAEAMDKAADGADGLGMEEIPVHSIRFRAECYRNIGANLYGGEA